MMQKLRASSRHRLVLVACAVLLLGGAATFTFLFKEEKIFPRHSCEDTLETVRGISYSACTLILISGLSEEELTPILERVDASIKDHMVHVSAYTITVPYGKEESLIPYFKSQPGIITVDLSKIGTTQAFPSQ